MVESGAKTAHELAKADFDALVAGGQFAEGPFREAFGDGYGEPYNPRRQAFGVLKDGRFVFAELCRRGGADNAGR